jgi:hypothetical protein
MLQNGKSERDGEREFKSAEVEIGSSIRSMSYAIQTVNFCIDGRMGNVILIL